MRSKSSFSSGQVHTNLSPNLFFHWHVSICCKLLLFCAVLVFIGQLQGFTQSASNSFISAVKADNDCRDYDIIKPPRFGKREAYLDKYRSSDRCNERKRKDGNSNRQRLVMTLISTLQKNANFQPWMSTRLMKLAKSGPANENLENIINSIMSSHAGERGKPLVDQEIEKVTSRQSITSLRNSKRMGPIDDRAKLDSESITDLTQNGFFGTFPDSQEYSQMTPHDFVAYFNYLVNSKPRK